MTSGEKIAALIKEKNLNMHKLAELSGVSYSTVYAIVKRNSENISSNVAIKLANALDVPITRIINFEDFEPDEEYLTAIYNNRKDFEAFQEFLRSTEGKELQPAREGFPIELIDVFCLDIFTYFKKKLN